MVFELINVDVSFVNALRRILLTEASIHSLTWTWHFSFCLSEYYCWWNIIIRFQRIEK